MEPQDDGQRGSGFTAPIDSSPTMVRSLWAPPPPGAPAPPGRRASRLIRALVAAVVVLVVAAVVIPFTVDTANPAGAMDAALTSTLGENSVTVTFTLQLSSGTTAATISGHAQVDLSTGTSALTLDATANGQSVTVRLVVVGTTIYVNVPGATPLPTGKQWVSITSGKLGSQLPTASSGGPLASLGGLGVLSSPSKMLQTLQQSGATVETLGPSTVGGTPVTGYRVVITPTVLAGLVGAPATAAQSIKTSGVGDIELTIDVDGAGLVRATTLKLSGTANGTAVAVTARATFTGYGQPVNVTPPPSTQVATLFQVLPSLSGTPAFQLLSAS